MRYTKLPRKYEKIGDMNKKVDQLIENVKGAENNNLIEVNNPNQGAGGNPDEPSAILGNITSWFKRGKNWLWTILGVGSTTVATYYILKKYKEKKALTYK